MDAVISVVGRYEQLSPTSLPLILSGGPFYAQTFVLPGLRGSEPWLDMLPPACLWRSMAGVGTALWSIGEARVAAAAELLCNMTPMNPLPHPIRRSMKTQAAAVADYALIAC